MSRRRKRRLDDVGLPPVLITCTDSFHHDAEEYRQLGFHLVGTLRHDNREQGGLKWAGHAPERGPLRTSGIKLVWGASPTVPVKRFRRDDGQPVYRFRCSCGLDVQRSEPDLARILRAWMRAFPGRPAEIDLTRLRG